MKENSITTNTVTIKVLYVDDKPMTLSQFRKLPRRDVFMADAFMGEPLGWINCHTEDCINAYGEKHLHILFRSHAQDGFICVDVVSAYGHTGTFLYDHFRALDQLFIAV